MTMKSRCNVHRLKCKIILYKKLYQASQVFCLAKVFTVIPKLVGLRSSHASGVHQPYLFADCRLRRPGNRLNALMKGTSLMDLKFHRLFDLFDSF